MQAGAGKLPREAEAAEKLVEYLRTERRVLGIDEALGGFAPMEEEFSRIIAREEFQEYRKSGVR